MLVNKYLSSVFCDFKINWNQFNKNLAFITSIRNLNKKEMSIFGLTIGQMCVDSRKKDNKVEKKKPINSSKNISNEEQNISSENASNED